MEKYKDLNFDGKKWFTYWKCEKCFNEIYISANKPYYLLRNLKNKKICKKCSLELQKGVNNPFYGKIHSYAAKKKISNSKTGISTSDHMKKPEYRKMFSELTKKRWDSGKLEETRKKLSLLMKKRHKNGELICLNRSKAEFEIIDLLEKNKIDVIPNFKIESKTFDIFIPSLNLIIEYNGNYWHCNPAIYSGDYFNSKKNMLAKDIWEYDKNKLDLAKQNGYNIEVIWETEYKKNNNIVLTKIKNYGEPNKNDPS